MQTKRGNCKISCEGVDLSQQPAVPSGHLHNPLSLQLTAALFKHLICTMLSASAGGSGKVDALKVLLGRNRFWVAAFGVAADVAFFVLDIGSEGHQPLLRDPTSPWSQFPLEMYHVARYVLGTCESASMQGSR